jgi:poly(hydroxyalkanoate) granule-associated protein
MEMPVKKKANVKDTVMDMGAELKNYGRNMWLAGLGVVAVVDEEARNVFDQLVSKGEKVEKDIEKKESVLGKTFDSATDAFKTVGKKVEDGVQKTTETALHTMGIPTHNEIQTLIRRVEQLTRKVNDLS